MIRNFLPSLLTLAFSASVAMGDLIYATSVVDHSPVAAIGQDPNAVLGAPDEVTADFAAPGPGEFGYVVVEFDSQWIVDQPGDDIFVHLFEDWEPLEGFHVDVSATGLPGSFVELEVFHTNTTQFGATILGCDLSDLNLATTRFVRVMNSTPEDPTNEGPEIDAIRANVPEPTTMLLLAVGFGAALLRRQR
ncbi:MAG: PEP-CTERM sorting domain-containing protein [Phycisphaerales bacterium]|nr:PEP-CTERM sorting domain-containing protein [Phycisphaerales bacterium]MCB9858667.1 PEP-CTERM sorting domain-containing protein [Phycisphaerales bacterium]